MILSAKKQNTACSEYINQICFLTCILMNFIVFVQDDNYVPVMKESNIDVKALSNAYKEKKKMRDDSNVVKIGKSYC